MICVLVCHRCLSDDEVSFLQRNLDRKHGQAWSCDADGPSLIVCIALVSFFLSPNSCWFVLVLCTSCVSLPIFLGVRTVRCKCQLSVSFQNIKFLVLYWKTLILAYLKHALSFALRLWNFGPYFFSCPDEVECGAVITFHKKKENKRICWRAYFSDSSSSGVIYFDSRHHHFLKSSLFAMHASSSSAIVCYLALCIEATIFRVCMTHKTSCKLSLAA